MAGVVLQDDHRAGAALLGAYVGVEVGQIHVCLLYTSREIAAIRAIEYGPGNRFPGLRLSKKSACGGLFRQMLKKCWRPGAQTPRPPGKAGRYELTLEGLRALQTSRKGF